MAAKSFSSKCFFPTYFFLIVVFTRLTVEEEELVLKRQSMRDGGVARGGGKRVLYKSTRISLKRGEREAKKEGLDGEWQEEEEEVMIAGIGK